MKSLTKKAISLSVQNDFLWAVLNATLIPALRYIEQEKNRSKKETRAININNIIKEISPDLTVKHGIFKGMKYPEEKSVHYSLITRLLGSYENEIHEVLERICTIEYAEIVNIGCGEGYYAVGFAIRIPTAKVYAYDINKEAVRLCKKMAEVNNVSSRLITGNLCDANTLKSIISTGRTFRALIFCDCEGYEKELFTEKTAALLASHDLLIEIHDFIDIEISSYIRSLFEKTHEIEVFQSLDDIKKAQQYTYEELKGFDMATRKLILAERRPAIMEWFYMKPRGSNISCKSSANHVL